MKAKTMECGLCRYFLSYPDEDDKLRIPEYNINCKTHQLEAKWQSKLIKKIKEKNGF